MIKYTLSVVICFSFFLSHAQVWQQEAKIVAPDRVRTVYLGEAVAVSGDYAAVGVPEEERDENGNNPLNFAGAVYVYHKNTQGVWEFQQKIVPADRREIDAFGISVEIKNDYLFIGCSQQDFDDAGKDSLKNVGAVYIYRLDQNSLWLLEKKLVPDVRKKSTSFGYSVSFDGVYLAIGAPGYDTDTLLHTPGHDVGAVYIFQRAAHGQWFQVEHLIPPDVNKVGQFGFNVSLSGDHLVVGMVVNSKEAYFYRRDAATGWNNLQVVPSSMPAYHGYQAAVSVDGNRAVYGASLQAWDTIGQIPVDSVGAAYVFEWENGSWSETAVLEPPDRLQQGLFGYDVAVEGNRILVGAPFNNTDAKGMNEIDRAGAAYVFEYKNGIWEGPKKLVPDDRCKCVFGYSVALDTGTVMVGAPGNSTDENGGNTLIHAGAVYLFKPKSVVSVPRSNGLAGGISCYPNPTNGRLNIDLGEEVRDFSIRLYTPVGQMVMEHRVHASNTAVLDIAGPKGTYIVEVRLKDEVRVLRVVKR